MRHLRRYRVNTWIPNATKDDELAGTVLMNQKSAVQSMPLSEVAERAATLSYRSRSLIPIRWFDVPVMPGSRLDSCRASLFQPSTFARPDAVLVITRPNSLSHGRPQKTEADILECVQGY